MSKRIKVPAVLAAILIALAGIAYVMSSCPSADMEMLAQFRQASRPTDCFPSLAGDGEVAPPTVQSLLDEEAELPIDLSGTWACVQISSGISNTPLVGEVRTTMSNYQLVQWTQRGNRLDGTAEVCAIDTHTDSSAGRTIIPQGFVDAIGPSSRLAVLEPLEGGGFRFRQARYVRLLGVDPTLLPDPQVDLATFEIPAEEDHVAVVDSDGDGHPGVTVNVEGVIDGSVYLAQRHMNEFCGDVLGPDRIEGYVYWETDQHVLDASSFIMNRDPEAAANPDWNTQWFIYMRVPEGTTCEELLAQREVWLGDAVRSHYDRSAEGTGAEAP